MTIVIAKGWLFLMISQHTFCFVPAVGCRQRPSFPRQWTPWTIRWFSRSYEPGESRQDYLLVWEEKKDHWCQITWKRGGVKGPRLHMDGALLQPSTKTVASMWTEALFLCRKQYLAAMTAPFLSNCSVAELKLFVLAPASAPTFKKFPLRRQLWHSFVVPAFKAFKWKSRFFFIFRKEYQLNSLYWSYSVWIMIEYTTLVLPGAGAETSVYRLQLHLRPKVPAPCGSSSGSTTLSN